MSDFRYTQTLRYALGKLKEKINPSSREKDLIEDYRKQLKELTGDSR